MSGYQDGALFASGQQRSVPALMAEEFKLVGGGSFSQPLMPDDNGLGLNLKPWESWFVKRSHLNFATDCKGVRSLMPIIDSLPQSASGPYLAGTAGNSFQNLSVPFGRTNNLFDKNFSYPYSASNPNPFYYRFASNSGSSTVYDDAVNQQATFFAAWLGMEDIYEYARTGGTKNTIPSVAVFDWYLDKMLKGLTANGAKGVIATIPDLNSFPFYSLVPFNGLKLGQNQADSLNLLTGGQFNFIADSNGFVIQYPKSSGMFRKLGRGELILLTVPLDSVKCKFLGAFTPMPDQYVLDSTEVQTINNAIWAYNAKILQRAAQYNLAVADMNYYFKTVRSGIKWDGVDFNAKFVSGGFFSLDGYHPNQKGYMLIANKFLEAINQKYNATIPPNNCPDCDGIKFP